MKKRFDFSRDQKIGIGSIAGVIIILTLLLNVNDHLGPSEHEMVNLDEIEFDQLTVTNDNLAFSESNESFNKNEATSNHLSNFNPNDLSVQGWEDLGFSSKQAKSIVKYRDNYGPFKRAEDVEKIYVVSEDKFSELRPYMIFENKIDSDTISTVMLSSIEINSATKEDLETIKGIGPVFAGRIIKYRSVLGGYNNSDQFQEVYGLKDESLNALINNVEIDPLRIDKININSASKNELKKHPYLKEWELVAKVLERRDKSKIQNLDFLLEEGTISKEEKEKIEPYISY